MPRNPDLPVNPELAALAAVPKPKRSRTPDVLCSKCEYIGRSNAEIAEHVIEKHPTGVFGPEKQEAYLKLILAGEGRHTAARAVGAAPATVARFMGLNAAYERAVLMAEEEYVERVEAILYTSALNAEPWAVKEVLGKRNSKRWGNVPTEINVNHSGTVEQRAELGPQLAKVAGIMANIEARRSLSAAPDVIDVEVVEDDV